MVYRFVAHLIVLCYFEVDSTESVWYTSSPLASIATLILKLTLQSQYGILGDVQ